MDLRRTIETVLKDAGVSREDRAELLSHGRTGVQAAHYEQTDLLPQKTEALLILERWVLGEISPAKVVSITKGKRRIAARDALSSQAKRATAQ
jgi:hypothetical protein